MSNVEDIAHFASLLNLLTSGKISAPIVVNLPKTTLSSNVRTDGNVIVQVSDLLGNPIKNVKVFLMKASSANDDSIISRNQQLNQDSDNEFSFNFFASKPAQGFYYLEFGVQTPSSKAIRTTFRTIKVVTSVSVDAINVDVLDVSDKAVLQSETFVFLIFYFFLFYTKFKYVVHLLVNNSIKLKQLILIFLISILLLRIKLQTSQQKFNK